MTIGTATEVKESIGLETTALILGGFYFHEFIRFIDFDWKLLTRKADQNTFTAKCVKATYLCCRYLSLISAIAELYLYFHSPGGPIPCKQLTQIDTGTSALAATCSSALIAVRVMVVWAWDARIVTIVTILFLALFAIDIRIIVSMTSTYDLVTKTCSLDGERPMSLPKNVVLVICDVVMLVCLLGGLYRWHKPGNGSRPFRLWRILLNQGVLYILLVSATEVPALVFLLLNLNPVMDTIFLRPQVIILVLASMRFHRSLNSFTPNQTRDDFTNTIRFATVDVGPRAEAEAHELN